MLIYFQTHLYDTLQQSSPGSHPRLHPLLLHLFLFRTSSRQPRDHETFSGYQNFGGHRIHTAPTPYVGGVGAAPRPGWITGGQPQGPTQWGGGPIIFFLGGGGCQLCCHTPRWFQFGGCDGVPIRGRGHPVSPYAVMVSPFFWRGGRAL